jgi:hypothetical protein
MIDTRVVSQELQDKIRDQVRKGQEQIRKGQETMAEAFKNWTATAQHITPQLPDMPSWTGKLPKPEELLAHAQEFAGQLLAAQRKTAEQLYAAQRKTAEELVAARRETAEQMFAAQRKNAEQLFAAQRKFAEEARDAVAPLLALVGVTPARSGGKANGHVEPAIAAADKPATASKAGPAKPSSAAKK